MSNRRITVIDYGMGNLWSVLNAFNYIGCSACVSSDPETIERANALVLPGVGSFRRAMLSLGETGIANAILEAVVAKGRNILGICLGMQLLGSRSTEDGMTTGLNLIPAPVERFDLGEIGSSKIPHIGFNLVRSGRESRLFRSLPRTADFYFVHSYRMLPEGLPGTMATCHYGTEFLAAYEHEGVSATQFHPEKSQTNGLTLLMNFASQ